MALCLNLPSCSTYLLPQKTRGRWFAPHAAISGQQPSDDRLSAHEFFEAFLRDRRGSGDFISRTSDMLWRNALLDVDEAKAERFRQRLAEKQKLDESTEGSGFLRLSQARSWSSGLDSTEPMSFNERILSFEKESDDLRRTCLLEYEALKRELSLVTLAVGAACTVYCQALFSFETAVSYGTGVFGSWIYLQHLGYQVDKTCAETVPQIFTKKKKTKRIGFTSSDLQDSLEKNFQGVRYALSSPRLLLPAALYGLWLLSDELNQSSFKLQITPMLLGLFAYKAAALVQTYRDNKDLLITFPSRKTEAENEYDL